MPAECPFARAPAPAAVQEGRRRCARCGQGGGGALYWCSGRAAEGPAPPEAGGATLTGGDDESAGHPAAPAPPREWVAGYRVRGVLGEGGGGVVYRALWEEAGREVALKMFRAGADEATRHRSLREVELARAHADLGLVAVRDLGMTGEGRLWYAMDLIDGPTLAQALEAPPRPPLPALVAVLLQASHTLHALHQRGVFHRDIKPSNILITPDGQALLADLGIALAAEETRLTRDGRLLGTPAFMAPEQLTGEVRDWVRVDVFAVGRVLQACLRQSEAADPLLRRIAERATQPEPDRRHASAGELAEDLQLWLSGRRLALRARHALRGVDRGRGLLAASLALAALGVGLGIAASGGGMPVSVPAPAPVLIGQWTFEPGEETRDRTGSWGALVLHGDARIVDGQLDLSGSGWTATGWAHAPIFAPAGGSPTIRDRTLVAWVTLEDPATLGGSAISLDRADTDLFDGIVYGELEEGHWGVGSSYYRRSQEDAITPARPAGQQSLLAVSFAEVAGEGTRVTLCHDGQQAARYEVSSTEEWSGPDSEVIFGVRHTLEDEVVPGALDARLEEARLYRGVLSCAEVAALQPHTAPDPPTP